MSASGSPVPSSALASASTTSATDAPSWPPRASASLISLGGVAPSGVAGRQVLGGSKSESLEQPRAPGQENARPEGR